MNVCIVSFGPRKSGNCAAIAELLRSMHDGARVFDFSEFRIVGCGDCCYVCFDGGVCPFSDDKEFEILDAVIESDLTYFIVPNYCDFPCAAFFAFNERSCGYFRKDEAKLNAYLRAPKKFIVVSNTNRRNFETAFSYHCDGEPNILFLSAKRFGKVSLAGDILDATEAADEVRRFAER